MIDPTVELVFDFRRWLRDRRYSEATVETYTSYVRRADVALRQVGVRGGGLARASSRDLERFWSGLPRTSASRNQCRKALIAFFESIGRAKANPATAGIPKLPGQRRRPRPLSIEEHEAFLTAALRMRGDHETFAMLLALTGARFGEVARARWVQFDLHGDAASWTIVGKGARRSGPRERTIPLHPMLVDVLTGRQAVARSEYVFPAQQRGRVAHASETYLRRIFAEVCQAAGVASAVPHQLRHTVATRALDATLDIRAVQELLGHSSLTSTQIYTALSPERLRAAVDGVYGGAGRPVASRLATDVAADEVGDVLEDLERAMAELLHPTASLRALIAEHGEAIEAGGGVILRTLDDVVIRMRSRPTRALAAAVARAPSHAARVVLARALDEDMDAQARRAIGSLRRVRFDDEYGPADHLRRFYTDEVLRRAFELAVERDELAALGEALGLR